MFSPQIATPIEAPGCSNEVDHAQAYHAPAKACEVGAYHEPWPAALPAHRLVVRLLQAAA
jgi:hypothetical protein